MELGALVAVGDYTACGGCRVGVGEADEVDEALVEAEGGEGFNEKVPGAAVKGLLHVEEDEVVVCVVFVLEVLLDHVEEHGVLWEERVRDETSLAFGDELDYCFVHPHGQDAHQYFIVGV